MKITKMLTLASLVLLTALSGCELAGLELQKKYDYDEKEGVISNELNKTVYEFLKSRPDEFSILLEGIEYAGLQDKYNEPNSTYMALTNTAFTSATAADLSYFYTHQLPNPTYDSLNPATGGPTLMAFSLTQFPKEQVRELLLYHIVKGTWTWSNLPAQPTWYDSYASADTAKVNLYLMKNDRSPTIGFNDFAGHYKLAIRARSTNLKANNGSYVHALDSWLNYPTRDVLRIK
ncbi:fasciclin domain-containing protein [Tellurirhabdus bombi]|uniref:fasciclin domain-containing protein n=1 Tax=Tellurirhabdus bombi TaxID=2907205 RepID=UPI001F403D7F|nr:fasciclin domain-containing protein [Tellurirhabdus bombi]